MNTLMTRSPKMSATVLFILACVVNSAWAASSGYVSGRLMFYNNQGNFCANDGRDCIDALYTEAEYGRNMPLGDTKIYVQGGWPPHIIGAGITDRAGYFWIFWYDPSWTAATINATIIWHAGHAGNRFSIRQSDGQLWNKQAWSGSLFSNTTTDLEAVVFGNSTLPDPVANLYDGALRMWRDGLSSSNRMRSYFTGVEIRAFDNKTCDTSCAYGASKIITIDSAASAFMPQARVMHEMGHIASYLSHRDQERRVFVNYRRDGTKGWHKTSPEYASASFEEGLATFFADRALYWQRNSEPYSCLSSASCIRMANNNVERSMGARSTCNSEEERWALTVMRYLRDVYDASNAGEPFDTNTESYHQFFEALYHFPNGYGNRDKDEPWKLITNFGAPVYVEDDRDGRSTMDFRAHIEAVTGHDTRGNYINNCSPAGD